MTAFACAEAPGDEAGSGVQDAQSVPPGHAKAFLDPIPKGNGRACATCHLPDSNFTITPAEVEASFQQNPNGPLFQALDADDFAGDFTTLRTKALFRVTVALPPNVSLVGSAEREVKLFRAVPSIFNVKLTAPYTQDGREATLLSQAKAAAFEHSRPSKMPNDSFFQKIVEFQEAQFSSPAVANASALLDAGQAPPPVGQDLDGGPLTPVEAEGFAAFNEHCVSCHNGSARDEMSFPGLPGEFVTILVSELNRSGLPVREYDVVENGTTKRVRSADPGRMLISGKASDANFFNATPLRGVGRTAPYFHDNSSPDLNDVLVQYNRAFTAFRLPLIRPEQFAPLVAYLNRL